jgi:hypothetical protein
MLFEGSALDSVGGTKAMFERRAGAQTAQLGLNHCAKISRRVVTKLDDAARLAFKHYHHASSDLRCWNCHYSLDLSNCSERPQKETAWVLQTT